MKSQTIRVGDLSFHTENFGDRSGKPCLLIAGAMAPGRLWTDAFCQKLVSAGFFVVRYDHRDIGESSGVDWKKEPYTLCDLANDAKGILDGYEIKKAHFVGHSMGGYVCQWIALQFPERVRSMTAIGAGPIGATAETDLPLTAQEQTILDRTWKILLGRKDGATLEETIQNFLPVWQYLNGEYLLDEKMATAYTRDLITRSRHPIRMGGNHELLMANLNLEKHRDILRNITTPFLLIHGEEDFLCLSRNARALAHAIPNNTLVMIPKMGHMLFHTALEEKIAQLVISRGVVA
ncbi:MAG: alpha/beta fold hydrolase [Chlamydiales bacterium]